MANVIIKDDPLVLVRDRWMQADADLQYNISKWRELDAMYKLGSQFNLNKRTDERGRVSHPDQAIARVSSSILINAVKTIAPRLYSLFDLDGDWFNIVPHPQSTTTYKSARYANDKLTSQFDEDAYMNIYAAVMQLVKQGKSFLKTRWAVEEGRYYNDVPHVTFDENNTPSVRWTRTSRKGVTFRGNKIELVPYWNMRVDPKARMSIVNAEYVIEDLYMPVDHLEEIARSGDLGIYDMDKITKLVEDMDDKGTQTDPRSDDNTYYHSYDRHRRDIKIRDYWEGERHFMVALSPSGTEEQILKKTENPHWHQQVPYSELAFDIDERELYPQGALEPLRDLHNVQSTALCQYIDANTMNLRPMRLVDEDLELDLKMLSNYIPNQNIAVQGLSGRSISQAIYEFKPELGNLLNSQLAFMSQTDTQAEKISGITEYITGTAGAGSNRTASGAALLTQNAEIRGSSPTTMIAIGMMRLLKQMHMNNQQFSHPLEDIKGDYKFYIFGDARQNSSMQAQGLQMVAPMLVQAGADPITVLKRLMKAMKIPAIEELLPEDGTLEKNQAINMLREINQFEMESQGRIVKSGGNGSIN